ncbi:MAG: hypothetical protein KDD36_13130, partial [Flavobacteriales bacterium]|nr:hypothetical protein [Flavobacteriales bacterium]
LSGAYFRKNRTAGTTFSIFYCIIWDDDMAKFPKELKDKIDRAKFILMDNYKLIEKLWPVHKLSLE